MTAKDDVQEVENWQKTLKSLDGLPTIPVDERAAEVRAMKAS